MNSFQALCLTTLVLCSAIWTTLGQEAVTREQTEQTNEIPECGLYLAVSSTSTVDEPKWGIFAGSTIPKFGSVGSGEVGIQAFQLHGHVMDIDEPEQANTRRTEIVDFMEQYIWVPHNSGGQFELPQGKKVVTAVPGIGVVGGCKFYSHIWIPETRCIIHLPSLLNTTLYCKSF
jgi:hypothetical protein